MKHKLLRIVYLAGFICSSGVLSGESLSHPDRGPSGIGIHDRVLFKTDEENIITTLDVIHKLNLLFASSFPHLVHSPEARSQYYTAMWPVILESVMDEFLMIADAKAKKIDVDPTTVNQEIEAMFGSDLSSFYEHFDMTPEDVFNVVHRTLVAQRVMGMMVRSRVMLKVTPGKVREHYQALKEEAENTMVWKYRVLTVKSPEDALSQQIADKVCARLNETKAWNQERLDALVLSLGGQLVCSEEFIRNDKELSEAHKSELTAVCYPTVMCSHPQVHKSGHKIFVLLDKSKMALPSLEEMETQIKQDVFMHYVADIEAEYKNKLRARYGFDPALLTSLLSESSPPLFSML